MNIEEIKTFLSENPSEVQGLLSEYTKEIDAFLDSESGKKLIEPKLHKNFSKGLETWKANNLDKIINDEIGKKFPNETTEQKRIRELESKLQAQEESARRSQLSIMASEYAAEYGVDPKFARYFLGTTEEETRAKVFEFSTMFKNSLAAEISKATTGKTPTTVQTGGMDKMGFAKMSLSDRQKLYNTNPTLYKELTS